MGRCIGRDLIEALPPCAQHEIFKALDARRLRFSAIELIEALPEPTHMRRWRSDSNNFAMVLEYPTVRVMFPTGGFGECEVWHYVHKSDQWERAGSSLDLAGVLTLFTKVRAAAAANDSTEQKELIALEAEYDACPPGTRCLELGDRIRELRRVIRNKRKGL